MDLYSEGVYDEICVGGGRQREGLVRELKLEVVESLGQVRIAAGDREELGIYLIIVGLQIP